MDSNLADRRLPVATCADTGAVTRCNVYNSLVDKNVQFCSLEWLSDSVPYRHIHGMNGQGAYDEEIQVGIPIASSTHSGHVIYMPVPAHFQPRVA